MRCTCVTIAIVRAELLAMLVALLGACGFRDGVTTGASDGPDGSNDGSATMGDGGHAIDAPPTQPTCLGSGAYGICAKTTPPATLALPATIYTSSGGGGPHAYTIDPNCLGLDYWDWSSAAQPKACVMFAQNITLDSTTVHVYGAQPLVLLATESITIAAGQLLDVSSHQNSQLPGPGAGSGTCAP